MKAETEQEQKKEEYLGKRSSGGLLNLIATNNNKQILDNKKDKIEVESEKEFRKKNMIGSERLEVNAQNQDSKMIGYNNKQLKQGNNYVEDKILFERGVTKPRYQNSQQLPHENPNSTKTKSFTAKKLPEPYDPLTISKLEIGMSKKQSKNQEPAYYTPHTTKFIKNVKKPKSKPVVDVSDNQKKKLFEKLDQHLFSKDGLVCSNENEFAEASRSDINDSSTANLTEKGYDPLDFGNSDLLMNKASKISKKSIDDKQFGKNYQKETFQYLNPQEQRQRVVYKPEERVYGNTEDSDTIYSQYESDEEVYPQRQPISGKTSADVFLRQCYGGYNPLEVPITYQKQPDRKFVRKTVNDYMHYEIDEDNGFDDYLYSDGQ